MDGSRECQMMVRWSGEVQVRVKSQRYSELDIDIGGHKLVTHGGVGLVRVGELEGLLLAFINFRK